MPKKYLSAKGSERLDQEREQIEAKFADLRKREEQLHIQQRDVIGSLLLGAVENGDWTETQLHDFLRPLIKRKKDFEVLGMSSDEDVEPQKVARQKPVPKGDDADESSGQTSEDEDLLEPLSASSLASNGASPEQE